MRHYTIENGYNTPHAIDAVVGLSAFVLFTILFAYLSGAGLV